MGTLAQATSFANDVAGRLARQLPGLPCTDRRRRSGSGETGIEKRPTPYGVCIDPLHRA